MKLLFYVPLLLVFLVGWFRVVAHEPAGHGGPSATATAESPAPVTNITMFLDPLPIPTNAVPAGVSNGVLIYDIYMRTNLVFLHHDLPPVEVWGYSDSPSLPGSYPGPTIQATSGVPIYVRWINELPSQYPDWLAAATINHGVTNQDVFNVVHLHGGANQPPYDGHPTNRFRPGVTHTNYYNNIDLTVDGETLWYHDHALGMTANNVYAGLAGFYLLRNVEFEESLPLPTQPYEIPLVFQDRDIQTNVSPATLLFSTVLPWHYMPVVNGKIAPYLEVEPRLYRFRILNGCNFRAIGLVVVTETTNAPFSTTNVPMYQIGTDDGFLGAPVRIPATDGSLPTLQLLPGERADVLIDFTDWMGFTNLVVTNSFQTNTSFYIPPGDPVNVVGGAFMQFRVIQPFSGTNVIQVPAILTTNVILAADLATNAVKSREITLDLSFETPFPGLKFATDSNVLALLNMKYFDEPVTETPRAGDVEIWEFINLTSEVHPMHVHLTDFFVLSRTSFQGFNSTNPGVVATGVSNYINDRILGQLKALTNYLDLTESGQRSVDVNERGPKDVVQAAPFAVTRIVMQWPTNEIFYGPYVYHCHILDHEDNDMMRPIQVMPPLTPNSLFLSHHIPQVMTSVQLGTSAGVRYDLQVTGDFVNWQSITNVIGTGRTLHVDHPASAGTAYQFYRAINPAAALVPSASW